MSELQRYELIGSDGDEIWIVDGWHPDRPVPLFRLRSHDGRFARKFLSALNAPVKEGVTTKAQAPTKATR